MIILPLAGIIAEFNPLHNGHKYLIDCAKRDGYGVAVVISGNFVQRGDTAIIPKYRRAECAISAGADVVCELPVPWSMSTAQNFALGGVSQLVALGVSTLYFGSECGDVSLLIKVAEVVSSSSFDDKIKKELSSGNTYAAVRQRVAEEILGKDATVLRSPNDTLAIEYILAAKKLGFNLDFHAIKRIGAGHDDNLPHSDLCSSSYVRKILLTNGTEALERLIPKEALDIMLSSPVSDIRRLDVAIISKIKQMTVEELRRLPDVSEGLENLIYEKTRVSYTYGQLCDSVKSKRYTMARIRRILLCAYLGIDDSYFGVEPPYVRILGLSDTGVAHIPKKSFKPIAAKVSEISALDDFSQKVFAHEMRINELYALSLDTPERFVSEYKEKLIKK